MYRRWPFLDRTMYTKETDDYYLNRNFPFVFCELIYSESEIIDFKKFARQINLQFPAQQVAVFNINQYNIRVLNDMSFSHDNDDKFHTFAECFKGYIDLYKLLNDNHMRQTIVDNYDYNEAVSYFEDVLKKLDEHFEQFNYKTFTIRERRRKTYAHNDKDYYLFSQTAIDDFPLDMQEIKSMASVIYNFAKTIQEKIGSKRANLGYPANSDDVKRLFGEKTDTDKWLEDNDNFF